MKLKLNVDKVFKTVQKTVSKHGPVILTSVGIAGMLTTTVLAVKATPKALEKIEEAKQEEKKDKLTPVETVKVAWKPYIPAIITGVTSTACLIGANTVNAKRNAALATALKLSETAFTEYKEKVVEEVGEEKEKVIREKANEERINQQLIFHEDGVVHTGNGNTLFFEPISKTVFRSSRNSIEKSINELNWKMSYGNEPYLSLEDFLDALKLPRYALGNELGWCTTKGLIDVSFVPSTTDTGEPCLSIEYLVPPEWDFDNLYG